ncbi:MAG: penicillin-binding protein 2 [Gammaproteobacteria bacterium]|nr:penicillin-binding protein 2 [Gammaproteobacteria bacterium]
MSTHRRIKDFWREQRIFEQRAVAASVIVIALAVVLFGRLIWLQIVHYDKYTDLAQGNRIRIEPQPAPRGIIYDRNGAILAENKPAYQLELIPEEVPNIDASLRGLVDIGLIAEEDRDDVRRTIRSRRSFDSVPIRLYLTDEDMARFAVKRHDFPGVDIRTRLARSYPHGELAVHALGHVGSISVADLARSDRERYAGSSTIGKIGVEAAFENVLRGRNGQREIMVNARGRSVEKVGGLKATRNTIPGDPGGDLLLTLDLEVQRVAEDSVRDQRAAIVALDPTNGDVLALVSRPGFDPNMFARGLTRVEFDTLTKNPDRPLFNRALRGTYPPGSTIKPVVALAGLTYGVTDPLAPHHCVGFFSLPGNRHRFREPKPKGHGFIDLRGAIAQSCDTYFYNMSIRLGVRRLHNFLSEFGLGRPTGIDIGGESAGILPSPEWKQRAFRKRSDQVWFPGETVIFGIGQGYITSTPIQLAQMTAILATRGQNFQPRLVRALRDPETQKVTEIAPKPLPKPNAGERKDWDRVVDGMLAVMQGGTASRAAADAPYTIAGKTGTAQVFTVAQNQRYNEAAISERLRDHAWFVAFAPVEAPKISIAVIVENGRSGSGTAAPIARKIMDAYLLRKFPPPHNGGTSTSAQRGSILDSDSSEE